jgi:type IV secretion system protein VirB10
MSEIPEQLPYEQDPYQDMDDSRSAVSGAAARQIKSGYKLAIAGGTLIAFMAFIWIGGHSQTKSTAPEQPPDQSGQMPVPFEAAPLVIPTQHTAMAPVSSAPTPTVVAGADSPIFAFSTGSSTTAPQAPVAAPPDQVAQAVTPGAPIEANAANALTARLQSSATQPAMAELLPHPDMLITQGTIIPCTLQTAINSELPGYVKCVLPDDVRSTTGNVVLLDRGTIVIGEIQSGLQQGQNRIFILWDRAETPDHVVIELASPATDALGRSGVPGGVDTHFWSRFGSAIMLSVIQGALQSGSALSASSGSSGTTFNNFSSNGEQLSDTALSASISLGPTLEKNQGDSVAIFVAKDLDFSDVYRLRTNN